ncbi:dCTP deaminase [Facilibium subflavum]|uniref:dCTP deaminase n=1 Tax=Facilibium subflavum TaxID=2219058 RepID=UPI000E64FA5E|nr:dCTP deaminase [Facilibium subflavum]
MILTGLKISEEVMKGNIIINDYNPAQISTNSYDLRLDKQYIQYTESVIDPKKKVEFEVNEIPVTGLHLKAGDFILASSLETIGSTKYVPLIHAKSGTARSGLFVHITADLIDIGSVGNVTFQLYATVPTILYPGMLLAQVTFWKPMGEIVLYDGKYQSSKGPQPSKTYLDYVSTESSLEKSSA